MTQAPRPIGEMLRDWRQRRRFSQMDLALEAEISTRHLSFLETGRSQPSRDMVLHLAEMLEVPLRDRNGLLIAAGYAPVFGERGLDDPDLAAARRAIDTVLTAHDPFPALAVDRHWTLVAANAALAPLMAGVEEASLLAGAVNVLRLSLHPGGLAPRILNLPEWRAHILARLRRQIDVSGDGVLKDLMEELAAYPAPKDRVSQVVREEEHGGVFVPIRMASPLGDLAMFSTTTVFGTPVDITLSELAIEAFFPADAQTGQIFRDLAAARTA
ncbi:helix-turn-helix domain-containing protein [Lacibacterium aquatile]|uniref:Helix-turn-helix domain-containing protein n=1 Tax=Lacibacterium aquatile TaxID=1168082 RepID=A0ABW5DWX3_9PROT